MARPRDDEPVELSDSDEDASRQPAAKRAKPSEGKQFPKGTVKKIRVHDFMTYAGTVIINPGPALNLVLGPNGTGKSSLVCAMCIGLGGSTKLLGRADNLLEYIRRGKSETWTEITLSGGPGARDQVLRRHIKAETAPGTQQRSFQSTWKLNGNDVRLKDIKDLVQSYNIQFENLCQFLPQDKVSEFARMNPQQLLEETEKAIGDAELYRLHADLIAKRKQYNEDKQSRDNSDKQMHRLKAEHEKQKLEYERFEAREVLRKRIELLHQQRLCLQLHEAQAAYSVAKRAVADANDVLQRRQGELKEDTRPIEKLEKLLEKLKADKHVARQQLDAARRALSGNSSDIEATRTSVDDVIAERAALRDQSQARANRIQGLAAAVAQLEADVAAAPTQAPPEMLQRMAAERAQAEGMTKKFMELDDQLSALRAQHNDLQGEIGAMDRQLMKLTDVRQQRLQKAEMRRRGITEVYQWIQANRGRFRGEVCGPIGMELSCNDPEAAGYLEEQLGNTLFHFVVTCREDEEMLSEHCKARPGTRFTVAAVIPPQRQQQQQQQHEDGVPSPNVALVAPHHPLGDARRYQQLGVTATLDEVFDAPALVKRYLFDSGGLTKTYIARPGSNIDAIVDAMPKPRPGQGMNVTIFMGGTRNNTNISAYNARGRSSQTNDARAAFVLASQVGAGAVEEQQRLTAQRADALRRRAALDEQFNQCKQEQTEVQARAEAASKGVQMLFNDIQKVSGRRNELLKQLKVKQRTYEQESAKPDPLSRQPQLDKQIHDTLEKLQKQAADGVRLVREVWSQARATACRELSLKEAEMRCRALKDASARAHAAVDQAAADLSAARSRADGFKRALESAKAARDAEAPDTPELRAALQAAGLPGSVEGVDEAVRDAEAERDAIANTNPNVLREYNARQQSIQNLSKAVSESDAALAALAESMAGVRDAWLPQLTSIVATINASFSRNFAEIGIAGEVVLDERALQEENYEACAIEIRVQFREVEALEVLNIHRQSGGERSVSTLLYLIALQGVTVTPFRVIDEINQGMDPINERKVFTQLVESACRPDTPQCFLLTPKLLPGLHFTPNITVLQIMNGPHMHTNVLDKLGDPTAAMYGRRAAALVAAA